MNELNQRIDNLDSKLEFIEKNIHQLKKDIEGNPLIYHENLLLSN